MVKFRVVEPNIVVVDEPIPLTELESMGEFIAALLDCEVGAVWLDATAATALGVQFALVARRAHPPDRAVGPSRVALRSRGQAGA